MMLTLAISISLTSSLALAAVAIWHREHIIACGAQLCILLTLLRVITLPHSAVLHLSLSIASTLVAAYYWHRERLTLGAAVLAWLVGVVIILLYPPMWMLSIVFLLGWAHFVGDLTSQRSLLAHSRRRDTTDVVPVVGIILIGTIFVTNATSVAALIVFAALAFMVNDVLASELGPLLPGSAHLPPQLVTVPHGTPGAISYSGMLAGTFGSTNAALCAAVLIHAPSI